MAKTKPEIPAFKTFTDFPAWVEQHQKLLGFQDTERNLERLISLREAELQGTTAGEQRIKEEAAALIEGRKIDRKDPEEVSKDLGSLRRQKLVLAQAIAMQKAALEKVETECSTEICQTLIPAHRAIVLRTIRALLELAAANQDHQAMMDTLLANRVTRSADLPHAAFPEIGNLADPTSLVSRRIIEFVQVGALTGQEPEVKAMLALQEERGRQAQQHQKRAG